MKITDVEVQNVMKIKLVKLLVPENLMVVGGDNEQGKSSLLDAIAMTLGGKKLCPPEPIRAGEDMAIVKIHVDGDADLMVPPSTVVRSFFRRHNGTVKTELEVVSDDGYNSPEPQTLLNRILSNATFDPLYFQRLKPKAQAEALQELVGVDPDELKAKREVAYDKRRDVGRDVKHLEGQLAGLGKFDDSVPEEFVSTQDLLKQMDDLRAINEAHAAMRNRLKEAEYHVEAAKNTESIQKLNIERIKKQMTAAKKAEAEAAKSVAKANLDCAAIKGECDKLEDRDLSPISQEMMEADSVNTKIRANRSRREVSERFIDMKARYKEKSAEIESIDESIKQIFEKAKWPVEGMSFNENGVTYKGFPFEQCSSAEQLRVSVAMGFSLNPSLKLLIIKDGSLLDEGSLKKVAEIAAKEGGQVFLERVGHGSECHIILKDGEEEVVEEDAAEVGATESETE